jgi:phosphoribosylformylglycinamidine synthase
MMPHPERAISFTQLPNWTYVKECLARTGQPLPEEGPGMVIFRKGVKYFG